MTTANDFKTGDRVRHVGRNEVGTVEVLPNGDVQVVFDRPTPRGNRSIGVYDEGWFRMYPDNLVHEQANTGSVR